MEETLNSILKEAKDGISAVNTNAELEVFKARFMGPKGSFTQATKGIGKLSKEERPRMGRVINEVKQQLEALFTATHERLQQEQMAARVGPPVDPTLPSPDDAAGVLHILTQVREEFTSALRRVGFVVAEGPEVETEFFCFDALNTPPDHPARDLHDTYYLKESSNFGNVSKHDKERYLMRTHTSTVQIRTMLAQKPPLRILSPGRCYRRDTVDATHSATFQQMEGLYVDKGVSVKDLKAILDYLIQSLLGKDAKTRFRPHFFPYTEPSFEVDFNCSHLSKVGKEWIEIGGCGMVDPAVFEAVGYDPETWTGYAFGMGIERIAMTLYGIDDIRLFYQNDLRFLRQFA